MLGFPTANMEILWDSEVEGGSSTLTPPQKNMLDFMHTNECGIYYGWCQVREDSPPENQDPIPRTVHKAAISIGWNPTFKDVKRKVIEPWILHDFGENRDFYGAELRLLLCGYVRGEVDFQNNFDLLVRAIKEDGDFCEKALEDHMDAKADAFFHES
eukprot:g7694.t1